MPYVQRDQSGDIVGVFANPQPSYAEEEISADAAELTAFRTRQIPRPAPLLDNVSMAALLARLRLLGLAV